MENISKKFGFIFGLLVLAGLVACGTGENTDEASAGGNGGSSETYTIRMSSPYPESDIVVQTYNEFKNIIEETSEGRIDVQIFHSGQVAPSEEESLQGLRSGQFDVSTVAASAVAHQVPQYEIFELPYYFEGPDQLKSFIETDVYQEELQQSYEDGSGVSVLGHFPNGIYSILNSSHPIERPTDLEGLIMRTVQSDIHQDTINTLGATATPMPYGEVFTAIQQGTVDGLMTLTSAMYKDQFYETANYLTLTHHNYSIHVLGANQDFLDQLPEDLQTKVREAAAEASSLGWELFEKDTEDSIDNLRNEGVEIVELTPEMRETFGNALQPVIDNNIETVIGSDLAERIEEEM